MEFYVKRSSIIKTDQFEVGDKLNFYLNGFGTFEAMAYETSDEGALFIFDECIAEQPMNKRCTNIGGFEASYLRKWMNNNLLPAFEPEVREHIKELTLPTYGMIFGHDDWYEAAVEPDKDYQFPLMKIRKNRIAGSEVAQWYWLRNSIKRGELAFARVNYYGVGGHFLASSSLGVRPAILIK